MDRIHKIHWNERKAIWRIYMVREETYEETMKTARPDDVWPVVSKFMSDAAKKKA